MHTRIKITGVALLTAVLGCSRGVTTIEYDASAARRTLVAALDAWKQARGNQLAKRQPPIRFVDDDWLGGWQLMDFQIRDDEAAFGPFRDVPVVVTLRDRTGRTVGKQVRYQVTLKPALAVLRSD